MLLSRSKVFQEAVNISVTGGQTGGTSAGPIDTGTDLPKIFWTGKDLGDHLVQQHTNLAACQSHSGLGLNADSQAPPETFQGSGISIFNKLSR